jgi:hypothetical protein
VTRHIKTFQEKVKDQKFTLYDYAAPDLMNYKNDTLILSSFIAKQFLHASFSHLARGQPHARFIFGSWNIKWLHTQRGHFYL